MFVFYMRNIANVNTSKFNFVVSSIKRRKIEKILVETIPGKRHHCCYVSCSYYFVQTETSGGNLIFKGA